MLIEHVFEPDLKLRALIWIVPSDVLILHKAVQMHKSNKNRKPACKSL